MTNDPSLVQQLGTKLLQSEAIMHVMLDFIIDREPMNFGGMSLPRSIIERLQNGFRDGKIVGVMETDE